MYFGINKYLCYQPAKRAGRFAGAKFTALFSKEVLQPKGKPLVSAQVQKVQN